MQPPRGAPDLEGRAFKRKDKRDRRDWQAAAPSMRGPTSSRVAESWGGEGSSQGSSTRGNRRGRFPSFARSESPRRRKVSRLRMVRGNRHRDGLPRAMSSFRAAVRAPGLRAGPADESARGAPDKVASRVQGAPALGAAGASAGASDVQRGGLDAWRDAVVGVEAHDIVRASQLPPRHRMGLLGGDVGDGEDEDEAGLEMEEGLRSTGQGKEARWSAPAEEYPSARRTLAGTRETPRVHAARAFGAAPGARHSDDGPLHDLPVAGPARSSTRGSFLRQGQGELPEAAERAARPMAGTASSSPRGLSPVPDGRRSAGSAARSRASPASEAGASSLAREEGLGSAH